MRSGGVFEFSCEAAWSAALLAVSIVKQRTLDDLRIESGLEIYFTHLLQQQIQKVLHVLGSLVAR